MRLSNFRAVSYEIWNELNKYEQFGFKLLALYMLLMVIGGILCISFPAKSIGALVGILLVIVAYVIFEICSRILEL